MRNRVAFPRAAIRVLVLLLMCLVIGSIASADTISFAGTLSGPTAYFTHDFHLANPFTVEVQTWSFGGGTNAAGTAIAAGGFDPLVAILASDGTVLYGTSDTLTNYYTDPVQGCPPAGTVVLGTGAGSEICGDIHLSYSLAAGDYTVLLSDANYQLSALTDPSLTKLSDGFTDFTGGEFYTCNFPGGGMACMTPSADWAFDLTLPASGPGPEPSGVPEPATIALVSGGAMLGWWRRRHSR